MILWFRLVHSNILILTEGNRMSKIMWQAAFMPPVCGIINHTKYTKSISLHPFLGDHSGAGCNFKSFSMPAILKPGSHFHGYFLNVFFFLRKQNYLCPDEWIRK